MPTREAARAGSSAIPGGNPFGHAPLFGVTDGNEPAGGQVGMASNGEPMPVGGTDPRCTFGIGSDIGFGTTFGIGSGIGFGITFGIALDWPFGNCPNAP